MQQQQTHITTIGLVSKFLTGTLGPIGAVVLTITAAFKLFECLLVELEIGMKVPLGGILKIRSEHLIVNSVDRRNGHILLAVRNVVNVVDVALLSHRF